MEWTFAAAGYSDAFAAFTPGDDDWPSDSWVGDGWYTTIYWAPGEAVLCALRTMEGDPQAGEMWRAHVVLTRVLVARCTENFRAIVGGDEAAMAAGGGGPSDAAAGAAPRRPVASLILEAVLGQQVTALVCHRAGHVVDLRHKSWGSVTVSLDELTDAAAVAEWGHSTFVLWRPRSPSCAPTL